MNTYLAIHVALGLVAWMLLIADPDESRQNAIYVFTSLVMCIACGPLTLGLALHDRLPPRP